MKERYHSAIHFFVLSIIGFSFYSCEVKDNDSILTFKGKVYDCITNQPIKSVNIECSLLQDYLGGFDHLLEVKEDESNSDGSFLFQFRNVKESDFCFLQLTEMQHEKYITNHLHYFDFPTNHDPKNTKLYLYPKGYVRIQLNRKDSNSIKLKCRVTSKFHVPLYNPENIALVSKENITNISPLLSPRDREPFWVEAKAFGRAELEIKVYEGINGSLFPKQTITINVENNQYAQKEPYIINLNF
ncbi:MAG: hypothetical protein KBB37_03305 [Bacteroidia bacterium]|nr:hypothetical protein [Bacteroidia bacterium]MBP7260291.1 hypothetical protein [Bacteroidia bacterium]MBP9179320.1 hypothetical protein [Bacteroidia bacterium]MBP9724842.1 hypothetical protein [Bacteroidia bacterium]